MIVRAPAGGSFPRSLFKVTNECFGRPSGVAFPRSLFKVTNECFGRPSGVAFLRSLFKVTNECFRVGVPTGTNARRPGDITVVRGRWAGGRVGVVVGAGRRFVPVAMPNVAVFKVTHDCAGARGGVVPEVAFSR